MLKQVTYVAYMQKFALLTGTPHSHEFWKSFKSVPEICSNWIQPIQLNVF